MPPPALVSATAPVLFIILLQAPAEAARRGVNNRPTQSASLRDGFGGNKSPQLFITERQHKAGPVLPKPLHYNKSLVCLFPSLLGRQRDRTG